MLFAIINRDNLQNSEELASLKDQVEEFRLHDRLGKQKYFQNRKKSFEPMTDANKNTSENITNTIT